MENWSLHTLNQKLKEDFSDEQLNTWIQYARNLRKQNLPIIFNLKHLSKITNINQHLLYSVICRFKEKDYYKIFRIKKKTGGYRFIHSPNNELKKVQYFINKYILSKLDIHKSCFSYHKDGGVLRCAEQHTNAKILFKYDLKDFFFCINEMSVYHLFKSLGYTKKLSFQIARLCTIILIKDHEKYIKKYKVKDKEIELGVLPQGAPTSPMLSNLLANQLDVKLSQLADTNNLIYTRYADDLTFSSNEKLSKIEIRTINSKILKIIKYEKFIINKNKISISRQGSRKQVLGLIVNNDTPKLSKDRKKKIDTFLYAIEKFGWKSTTEHYGFRDSLGFFHHLDGIIIYAEHIDKDLGKKYRNKLDKLLPKLFR
jgi:RNA-directed DNA polymerase